MKGRVLTVRNPKKAHLFVANAQQIKLIVNKVQMRVSGLKMRIWRKARTQTYVTEPKRKFL